MSYYLESASHIKNKIKVELDLSIKAAKKQLDHPTGLIHLIYLLKRDFIALKDEVDKLDIAKLVNAAGLLNNLKTKVENLDAGKLKLLL